MLKAYIIILSSVLLLVMPVAGQEGTITFGLQYKPVFQNKFLGTGPEIITQNDVEYTLSQKFGFCGGGVIRRGFSKRISLEVGINYVKRNYELEIGDGDFTSISDFSIIGYEIPVQALVFIQLGDRMFMNAAGGLSVDMYASDVAAIGERHETYSGKRGNFQGGVVANLGFEYRTENSGFIYFGASYHQPFTNIYRTRIRYEYDPPLIQTVETDILGNYLTVDLRYFFHPIKVEKKEKKNRRRRGNKKETEKGE